MIQNHNCTFLNDFKQSSKDKQERYDKICNQKNELKTLQSDLANIENDNAHLKYFIQAEKEIEQKVIINGVSMAEKIVDEYQTYGFPEDKDESSNKANMTESGYTNDLIRKKSADKRYGENSDDGSEEGEVGCEETADRDGIASNGFTDSRKFDKDLEKTKEFESLFREMPREEQ